MTEIQLLYILEVHTTVRYSWDEEKRQKNIFHGLDFIDAKTIFEDPHCYFYLDLRYSDERWHLTGRLKDKIVVLSYKWLTDDQIRVISMRLATRLERSQYQEKQTRFR